MVDPWQRGLRTGAVLLFAGAASVAQVDRPVVPASVPARQNRLAETASPYLRQHQYNPVDWYPWGPEALAKARREQKPIFLSIGYAACHWCHVMAAESFADPAIAALMNAQFVCIKVDREERPDLDEIYLSALQAMGQQGGWPLSAWLTPDGKPFFAGTYFPPTPRGGLPAFPAVCEQLAKAWAERRTEVVDNADQLAAHLRTVLAPELPPGEPTAALLAGLLPQAAARFDRDHGGFGEAPHWAPKFPAALELQALLGLDEAAATTLVTTSLQAMQRGGMHDQLGGGFHRYSTDRQWLVPHFEKMLYDNALLATLYADAFRRTGDASFGTTARATLDFLLRELRDPRGGFWSSLDAVSDGGEGKYYTWTPDELRAAAPEDAGALAAYFGVSAAGHVEGRSVLSCRGEPPAFAAGLARGIAALQRSQRGRVRPATDDKVLTAWNGLALQALATGYATFAEPRYRVAAQQAADFLARELWQDGRLARSWHGGKRHHAGYLEDYAGLALGCFALFEVDPEPRWLKLGRDVLAAMQRHFAAPNGSFFVTADDHEALLARSGNAVDGATPSGQALAAHALLRGGLWLGDASMYERGVAVLRTHHALLRDGPTAVPTLVTALQFHLGGPREIVVVGAPEDPRTQALLAAARQRPGPAVVALLHDGNRQALAALSPVFVGKTALDGVPAAYVCRAGRCERPVTDPVLLRGER